MINELMGSPTRSENVYLANIEQASIYFTHAEHHLIKGKAQFIFLCNPQNHRLMFVS